MRLRMVGTWVQPERAGTAKHTAAREPAMYLEVVEPVVEEKVDSESINTLCAVPYDKGASTCLSLSVKHFPLHAALSCNNPFLSLEFHP